ncbi:MAG: hypothetical protein JWM42_1300 [Burkholderia sp.]|nr:hypothetical protein [Burkholderia sp.]
MVIPDFQIDYLSVKPDFGDVLDRLYPFIDNKPEPHQARVLAPIGTSTMPVFSYVPLSLFILSAIKIPIGMDMDGLKISKFIRIDPQPLVEQDKAGDKSLIVGPSELVQIPRPRMGIVVAAWDRAQELGRASRFGIVTGDVYRPRNNLEHRGLHHILTVRYSSTFLFFTWRQAGSCSAS